MKLPETIKPFLQKHRISVLAVLNEDGEPHSASLHYAWDEKSGSFIFFTRTKTLKYQALSAGIKKASLVIGFSEEEFCTLQMRGVANTVEDEKLAEVYLEKYPNLRAYAKDKGAAFIVFTPSWFRYSDLKPDDAVIYSSDDK